MVGRLGEFPGVSSNLLHLLGREIAGTLKASSRFRKGAFLGHGDERAQVPQVHWPRFMNYSCGEIHCFVYGMSRIPPEKLSVYQKELDEPDAADEDKRARSHRSLRVVCDVRSHHSAALADEAERLGLTVIRR